MSKNRLVPLRGTRPWSETLNPTTKAKQIFVEGSVRVEACSQHVTVYTLICGAVGSVDVIGVFARVCVCFNAFAYAIYRKTVAI